MKTEDKVLIFDFDGTIADTHLYICHISNTLSKTFNFELIDFNELAVLKEKSIQEIMTHLKVPLLKVPAIVTMGKKEYKKNIGQLKPIDGLKNVLTKLYESGRRLGILSSNALENIQHFLDLNDLNVFEFVQTTPKVWSKNTCLKNLLRDRNIHNDQVIYVGDEIRDVVAAQRLGMKVAAVTWGYNTHQALEKHNPDYLIDTPEQLLKLF